MSTNVRANCPSIKPAAWAAPTGSHHVLETKKYVLARVISQITTSNARPIPQSSRTKTNFPSELPRPTARSNSRRRVYHSHLRKLQPSCTRKLTTLIFTDFHAQY